MNKKTDQSMPDKLWEEVRNLFSKNFKFREWVKLLNEVTGLEWRLKSGTDNWAMIGAEFVSPPNNTFDIWVGRNTHRYSGDPNGSFAIAWNLPSLKNASPPIKKFWNSFILMPFSALAKPTPAELLKHFQKFPHDPVLKEFLSRKPDMENVRRWSRETEENLYASSSMRGSLIRLAYENPELRGDILPLIVDHDMPQLRVASMGRESWVLKGILRQIGRILPRAARVQMRQTAVQIRRSGNVDSVYRGLISTINSMGNKIGLRGVGDVVDRFAKSISLAKLWNAIKTFASDGWDAFLKLIGVRQPIARTAMEKDAVDPLMAIGGGIAILAIIAMTIWMLSHTQTGSPFVDALISARIVENAVWAIAAILEAIASSDS